MVGSNVETSVDFARPRCEDDSRTTLFVKIGLTFRYGGCRRVSCAKSVSEYAK